MAPFPSLVDTFLFAARVEDAVGDAENAVGDAEYLAEKAEEAVGRLQEVYGLHRANAVDDDTLDRAEEDARAKLSAVKAKVQLTKHFVDAARGVVGDAEAQDPPFCPMCPGLPGLVLVASAPLLGRDGDEDVVPQAETLPSPPAKRPRKE